MLLCWTVDNYERRASVPHGTSVFILRFALETQLKTSDDIRAIPNHPVWP